MQDATWHPCSSGEVDCPHWLPGFLDHEPEAACCGCHDEELTCSTCSATGEVGAESQEVNDLIADGFDRALARYIAAIRGRQPQRHINQLREEWA